MSRRRRLCRMLRAICPPSQPPSKRGDRGLAKRSVTIQHFTNSSFLNVRIVVVAMNTTLSLWIVHHKYSTHDSTSRQYVLLFSRCRWVNYQGVKSSNESRISKNLTYQHLTPIQRSGPFQNFCLLKIYRYTVWRKEIQKATSTCTNTVQKGGSWQCHLYQSL